MPLLPIELARLENQRLLLRAEISRLNWTLDDLPAADGYTLRVRFGCGVKPIDDPTESKMLRDVLMGSRHSVTFDDATRHFQPSLRAAAAGVADDKGVEAWLSGTDKDDLLAALKRSAERVAFACGLEILSPFQLDLESPSFEQKRLKDLQRTLAEQEAAGRVEQFNRAADLLSRFETLREKAPEVTPGALLNQLSPVDQGATLQTLLLASAKKQPAADLWAVGGEFLIRVEQQNDRASAVPVKLPSTLGPLRSVQAGVVDGERVLLVGARGGFYVVNRSDLSKVEAYPDGQVDSQLGFSRVLFLNREHGFVACHGEAGVVRWAFGRPQTRSDALPPSRFGVSAAVAAAGAQQTMYVGQPTMMTMAGTYQQSMVVPSRPAGPRNLQPVDDRRVLLSVGPKLWLIDDSEATEVAGLESKAEIAAIVPGGRLLFVVHEDGTMAIFDTVSRSIAGTRHRPMRVRTAGALPWLGSTRLLLAGDDGPIQCVGVEDAVVSEYASHHRGLRVVTGSAEWVAGVSSDRQRIILWNTWEGRQPVSEVYVTAQIRHRIADIAFA